MQVSQSLFLMFAAKNLKSFTVSALGPLASFPLLGSQSSLLKRLIDTIPLIKNSKLH